jgi:glutamyl-tRNA synthetase
MPRVRFAPSPTGFLHIGGARTALFNWLYARRNGGTYILRIEDTDPERSKREHEEQICRDLRWMGLDWGEGPQKGGESGPYRQSERMDRYGIYVDRLIAEGKAYRCTATADELAAMRESQAALGQRQKYDGRNREMALGADCGTHVVRLKIPLEGVTVVEDQIKGRTVFKNEELDDFIILRSDGSPTYNFVVVVDDHEMGVTHVIRGDDHLNNTPKQINLYNAIGAALPNFAHVPMILGSDGKRLSKRHGATSVGAYADMGILKEGLFNYLCRLGWAHGNMELFSAEEAVEVFTLKGINKAGAQWDMEKLLWVNQQWIMRLETEDLAERARPFFEKNGTRIDETRYLSVIRSMQPRAKTLVELAERSAFFFTPEREFRFDEEAAAKAFNEQSRALLAAFRSSLEEAESWTGEALGAAAKAWIKEESARRKAAGGKKVKLGQLLFPVRIAICGGKAGPDVFDALEGLGRQKSLERLAMAVSHST